MSRRFGRNQRRRMREELAKSEAVACDAIAVAARRGKHAENLASEAAELRAMIEDIAGRVGCYAITAGEPCNFDADWLERGQGRFQMSAQPAMASIASFGSAMDATMAIHDETMRLLEVEAVRAPMSRDMHCRVTFDKHVIGYAMSDHALHNMTAREIERRIAPEIARLMAHELKVKK